MKNSTEELVEIQRAQGTQSELLKSDSRGETSQEKLEEKTYFLTQYIMPECPVPLSVFESLPCRTAQEAIMAHVPGCDKYSSALPAPPCSVTPEPPGGPGE